MAENVPRSTPVLSALRVPIVQAPMAGGPSNPALAAAVNRGGGLGFLAGGYLSAKRLASDVSAMREFDQSGVFGVNVFVGGGTPADPAVVQEYARRLRPYAEAAGVALGEPRFDDDAFDEKIQMLCADPVAVVSFTFGAPPRATIKALHDAGSEVWLTVTSPAEASLAAGLGADALVVQGIEAGGHRGAFKDDATRPPSSAASSPEVESELTLLAAIQMVRACVELPLIGSGAIMTGAGLGAVLVAGASAGQLGTAYLRSTEAGTSDAQREAVASTTATVLTRVFSGRLARGVRNRWDDEQHAFAPRAYPEVHHLTSPLRAHGRRTGDPDLINLWAGQAHSLARSGSAEQITAEIGRQARHAVAEAATRLQRP